MLSPRITILLLGFLMLHDVGAIFFGKLATPGRFKYQVLIHTRRIIFTEICGGAIVDETHIVTAWHCVDKARYEDIGITVGAITDIDDPNAKQHYVMDISLHESKSCIPGELRCYDIAVISVTHSFEYNYYVNEINLPDSDITVGDECVFAGFGASEENPDENSEYLRYGYGKIWSTHKCNGKLPTLKEYEFCFHHRKNTSLTTVPGHGDSGGPFVCHGVLTGVIIRGGYYMVAPTTAINVFHVLDFIKGVLDADNCAAAAVADIWDTFRWRP